jgi:K+/H+ antiporter YhaU regulatory subunit KhtT
LTAGQRITVGNLLADPSNWRERLHLEVVMIRKQKEDLLFPADDVPLEMGDRLLLAGRDGEAQRLQAVLENDQRLEYLLTGRDRQHGVFWRWLEQRSNRG